MEKFCVLFTGLPCSGKTTLGTSLYLRLKEKGIDTQLFDGDKVRLSISKDLDFSKAARIENMLRVAKLARSFMDNGTSCILSMVAPYAAARSLAREIIGEGFVEVYLNTPLSVCEERDVKGMYKQARLGKIKHFTGVDDVYEVPQSPDIVLCTHLKSPEECLEELEAYLQMRFITSRTASNRLL